MDKIGQRKSQKRQRILEVIQAAQGPLTVNEIHEKLSDDPVGIATVYRTIKLLLEKKEIQDVMLADGVVRYENKDLGHHHHFYCEACEQVFDIADCHVDHHEYHLPTGFKVKAHEMTFYGLCPDCQD